MEILIALLIGTGLSAAAGFRLFVPFFVISIAANTGHLTLAPGFEWISTEAAVISFGLATILEIGAYYIPFLDNLLDTVSAPASFVAGSVLMASVVSDISPLLKWSLAVIAGGGVALSVQGLTAITRLSSSTLTAGLGNPVFSTTEAAGSTLLSVFSVFVPLLALILVTLLFYFIYNKIFRVLYRRYFAGVVELES